jgi:hypothetical protein
LLPHAPNENEKAPAQRLRKRVLDVIRDSSIGFLGVGSGGWD